MKLLARIVTAAIGFGVLALGLVGFSEATIPAIHEAFYAYEIDAVVTTQNVVHAVAVWIITGLAATLSVIGGIVGLKGLLGFD